MTAEQDVTKLQQDFEKLKQEIVRLRNPFSRSEQLKLEQGSTGAARIRRIPLFANNVETAVIDDHGNFTTMTHFHLANAGTETIWYVATSVPTDYVVGTTMSFKYIYTNAGTTGNLYWTTLIKEFTNSGTNTTTLLTDTSAIAVPSTANTMSIRSQDLTTNPTKDYFIAAKLDRAGAHGSDTNSSTTSLYNVWLEYIAFI